MGFKEGSKVVCIDDTNVKGFLEEGKEYEVLSSNSFGEVYLKGVKLYWNASRFKEVLTVPHNFAVGDKVRVVKEAAHGNFTWVSKMDLSIGGEFTIKNCNSSLGSYQLDNGWYYLPESLELVGDEAEQPKIDSHYNFSYTITEADLKAGVIKLDPYFISQQWDIGSKDPSGVIWHIFKTCARFGEKNSKEREITAIYKSIKRLAELEGVSLN